MVHCHVTYTPIFMVYLLMHFGTLLSRCALSLRLTRSFLVSGTCQWWSRHFLCPAHFHENPWKMNENSNVVECMKSAWNCLMCISCYWAKTGLVPAGGWSDDCPKSAVICNLCIFQAWWPLAKWMEFRESCTQTRKTSEQSQSERKVEVLHVGSHSFSSIHRLDFNQNGKQGLNVLIEQGWMCIYRSGKLDWHVGQMINYVRCDIVTQSFELFKFCLNCI